jgi:hypothetical protein
LEGGGGVSLFLHFCSPSEVDGRRSPQKPEGPSGRRCEDWTRRKELLFPDAGIVVRDLWIPPDTRLVGSSPCLIPGVHRDQHLALDSRALIRGFRAPALATVGLRPGPAPESLPRRKPRGGWGTVRRARLWGFQDRDGCRVMRRRPAVVGCFLRKRGRLAVSMATMRGNEGFASVEVRLTPSGVHRARVPACGRRRRRSWVRGGMWGDGHEVSILIRVGDWERQGRGPSNVSTTIIRPPQQGQRRADETSSA